MVEAEAEVEGMVGGMSMALDVAARLKFASHNLCGPPEMAGDPCPSSGRVVLGGMLGLDLLWPLVELGQVFIPPWSGSMSCCFLAF